ncbi:MAG: AAA family ATPase [Chitinophagaceae bacterium]
MSKLVDDINNEFKEFFLSAPQLKFRITHTDSDGVLDSVIPHFTHADVSQIIPSRRHGNGLISLQWLLLLLQFGKNRASSAENFIMAIEEPELHIPPHTQQKLIHRLQAVSNQAISTTHSPAVASIADPTDILVIHNSKGDLSSKRLLEKPLENSDSNSVRKLFQINRNYTISALMHEAVLIPEGRIDFEIMRLLTKAVDLRKGWINNGPNDFGIAIGLVPTHDAAVIETYKLFSGLHNKVCCVVDGDKEGENYIKSLLPLTTTTTKILSWPKDWFIEDVVGWILTANEADALSVLSASLRPFTNISELVSLLKSKDRKANGLKEDYLAYELIADAIYQIKECNKRSQDLLNGITAIISNQPSKLFIQQPSPKEKVYVFTP